MTGDCPHCGVILLPDEDPADCPLLEATEEADA